VIDQTADIVNCFDQASGDFYYLTPDWGTDDKASFSYQLVKNDGTWMWSDASPDVSKVALNAVEPFVNGLLGPVGIDTWLNHFEIANLGHNSKFDPYCDDLDDNGECNYTDLDGDGKGTLVDPVTEPTLSEPPYWSGDSQAQYIEALIDACGGMSETTLKDCLIYQRDYESNDINSVWADWSKLFACTDSARTMRWIDLWKLTDASSDNNVGDGCGASGAMGLVRMRNLIKRNNAYDVARPNKMLKLISAATASSGTGVSIDSDAKIFAFQEAIALMFLRFTMPMEVSIYKDGSPVGPVPLYLDQTRLPDTHADPAGGLLRAFLEEAGAL
jgi:hypothetical protein